MCSSSLRKLYLTIKNGSLLEEKLDSFSNNDLKLFQPFLTLSASPFSSEFVLPKYDALRNRLLEIPINEEILSFLKIDFNEIEQKCREIWASPNFYQFSTNFRELNASDKILSLCSHLILKMQGNQGFNDKQETFEPFDSKDYQEEVVWIITLMSFYMPNLFNFIRFSRFLLLYENGSQLIYLLLLNQPDMLNSQIHDFLQLEITNESGFLAKQRQEVLIKLFSLEPEEAELYMMEILSSKIHLNFAVKILCLDIFSADFFVDILISHFLRRDDSLTVFITKESRISLRKICVRIGKVIEELKNIDSELNERMILLIALFCSYSSIRLSNEEIHQWVHFLTHQLSTNINVIKLTLAVIIACPNLTPNQFCDETVENYLIQYFKKIRETAALKDEESASLSQMMLLVAIHMNFGKGDELANLVSSVLGFTVSDTLRKLNTVKSLYLQHAVTDRDFAEKASKLGVTKGLNANSSGYLPVHCVNHLLTSRMFSKYQIPIQDWIKSQIYECTAPVHPIMTSLLKNFTNSCVPTAEHEIFNKAIDEEFFWDIFSTELFDNSSIVIQLLALFYLVAYNYKLEIAPIPKSIVGTNRAPLVYSQKLWAKIPIRYLLIILDVKHEDFSIFRPFLLRFISASMPHMLPTINSSLNNIDQQIAYHGNLNLYNNENGVSINAFKKALNDFVENTNKSSNFMRLLNRIYLSPIQEQYRHFETIVTAMELTLRPLTPRQITDKVVRIWQCLENLIPRRLYELTLQIWLTTPNAALSFSNIVINNELLIAETPLILFRVDDRVFRSPPHLRCLMHMLSFYLEASKNANNLRLLKANSAIQNIQKGEVEEKLQLLKSYIGTQYLAVVQLLLELCDGNLNDVPELAEIREICCAQIHQMFIADSMLPKLVHFNTYPLRFISIMVKGVPSAHVLISFLGDLLAGSNLERRIFGICLMSELIEKYKIPMAFSAVGLISDVLDTLLACTVNEEHIVLFLNIVPAISRLIIVSPFHSQCFIETLERMRKIAFSRLALYTSVISARSSPEKCLIDLLDTALNDLKIYASKEALPQQKLV